MPEPLQLRLATLEENMVEKIAAVFDGKVFHPAEPIALEPNTRVQIIIETVPHDADEATSFLQTAQSLNLDGPPDWSAKVDKYLYSVETQDEG